MQPHRRHRAPLPRGVPAWLTSTGRTAARRGGDTSPPGPGRSSPRPGSCWRSPPRSAKPPRLRRPAPSTPSPTPTAPTPYTLRHPHLYRLATERPLPRHALPEGLEERAAAPLMRACAGDVDLARARWAFGHGMVILEIHGRFPDGVDLDAAWRKGTRALHS
ncbi:TetR-like C-terminal domain-containing protein [Streptomyces sp. NPDC018059]|uniref:TetR-like C-terminal domain-containing protein n=1 Tax=Streptomyces sp. NPDC018059 TaxID=3365041 RepID=UPI0037937CB3